VSFSLIVGEFQVLKDNTSSPRECGLRPGLQNMIGCANHTGLFCSASDVNLSAHMAPSSKMTRYQADVLCGREYNTMIENQGAPWKILGVVDMCQKDCSGCRASLPILT
jgi:hypothetical protein